jgi:phosphoglucosamine mutase
MRNLTLSGIKIVVDCANGAAYKVAPEVFWELGAEVIAIGNEPDGLNINEGCGATNTKLLQETVVKREADIGFAIDGDADRIIVVDEKGDVIDGDYIIAVIATDWKNRGKLKGNKVVATTMSNMALEKYLNSMEVNLIRSEVGDKYVIEKMIEIESNLGGEKSGHIIPLDYSTTGDALVSALQVLNYLVSNNKKASDIQNLYRPYPQVFKNLNKEIDIHSDYVKNAIFSIENEVLQKSGRLIVRESGTENVIRIMVESENEEDIERALGVIDKAVSQM